MHFKLSQKQNACQLRINTIPVSVVGVLFVFVLMIMSGMGWAGAQSHMRHADNRVSKVIL